MSVFLPSGDRYQVAVAELSYEQTLVPGLSQYEIAKLWGVSRSRVHQIERKAIAKLRDGLLRDAAAAGQTIDEWLDPACNLQTGLQDIHHG